MPSVRWFVKPINPTYCASLLGQSQDVDACGNPWIAATAQLQHDRPAESPERNGRWVSRVKKPFAIVDFRPAAGSSRLGVWEIFSETMQLNLAAPGAARPTSLFGGSTYLTR